MIYKSEVVGLTDTGNLSPPIVILAENTRQLLASSTDCKRMHSKLNASSSIKKTILQHINNKLSRGMNDSAYSLHLYQRISKAFDIVKHKLSLNLT